MSDWQIVLLVNLIIYGGSTALFALWHRKPRASAYSLLRVHVGELAGERAPNDHHVAVPVYVAVPTLVHPTDPCTWVYFDLDMTGADYWHLRRLMANPPINGQWLHVRARSGQAGRLHFTRETWTNCR